MSIFTGISSTAKLGGIFGLSSYLVLGENIKDFVPKDNPNKDTPVYMGHGDSDPLVKYEWGQRTAWTLKELGFKVDFKTYRYEWTVVVRCVAVLTRSSGLAHSADPDELDDLEAFIKERLSPVGTGSGPGL